MQLKGRTFDEGCLFQGFTAAHIDKDPIGSHAVYCRSIHKVVRAWRVGKRHNHVVTVCHQLIQPVWLVHLKHAKMSWINCQHFPVQTMQYAPCRMQEAWKRLLQRKQQPFGGYGV